MDVTSLTCNLSDVCDYFRRLLIQALSTISTDWNVKNSKFWNDSKGRLVAFTLKILQTTQSILSLQSTVHEGQHFLLHDLSQVVMFFRTDSSLADNIWQEICGETEISMFHFFICMTLVWLHSASLYYCPSFIKAWHRGEKLGGTD